MNTTPPVRRGPELTKRAVDAARSLLHAQGDRSLKLRLLVSAGSGCAVGPDCRFIFELEQNDEDWVADYGELSVLVDPMSRSHLEGSRIDFVDELDGSRFVILNLNPSIPRCSVRSQQPASAHLRQNLGQISLTDSGPRREV